MSAVIEWFASAGAPRQRPDPMVEIGTGAAVSAWVLRVTAAVALLVASLVVVSGIPALVVAGALAVAVAVAPHGVFPAVTVLLVALELLRRPAGAPSLVDLPAPVTTAVVLYTLHLMVFLSRRVADLSPRAAVEWAALRRGAVPALAAQGVAQLGAVLAIAIAAPQVRLPWVAVGVLAVVVALLVLAGRTLHRSEQQAQAEQRAQARQYDHDSAGIPRWGRLDD
ncbi:hypothetical protein [Ruania alba]|uniref:Uncharacterized protein n=1 Tax=Ruania alba TaxID=648782 RepID=A0A1H5CXJ0_9MICO|nr:hypothetical protein [Ruania alba]SED71178.1 hypothetical protein SAMN04488554_0500 [Ruania alba]